MGEAERTISQLRSLMKAGRLEKDTETLGEDNPIKRRNDGKNLEEEVKELLESMGLKAATTKTTGDGGIDIVAYSDSPLFSGKYIVQCKDWTGSVGKSVVRDLYGVVTAEAANKGILITTGTITKPAQKFAEGKPLEGDSVPPLPLPRNGQLRSPPATRPWHSGTAWPPDSAHRPGFFACWARRMASSCERGRTGFDISLRF